MNNKKNRRDKQNMNYKEKQKQTGNEQGKKK